MLHWQYMPQTVAYFVNNNNDWHKSYICYQQMQYVWNGTDQRHSNFRAKYVEGEMYFRYNIAFNSK